MGADVVEGFDAFFCLGDDDGFATQSEQKIVAQFL